MAEYFVLFDAAPAESSDATLGKSVSTTKVLAPLQTIKVVYVEATTEAKASEAVLSLYSPQSGYAQKPLAGTVFKGEKPIVVATANWTEK